MSPSNTRAKVARRSQDGSASVTLRLTCGFIFKLKKKIIVIYDLEYFAIPFQIKDRTLKFVTKNVSKLLGLFTVAPYFGFHAY